MRVWLCIEWDADEGCIQSWHPSKAAAMKHSRSLDEEVRGAVRPIEIPTDKRGLIEWLNDCFNRDNG